MPIIDYFEVIEDRLPETIPATTIGNKITGMIYHIPWNLSILFYIFV
jgi:hypothetical protein